MSYRTFHSGVSCEVRPWVPCVSSSYASTNFVAMRKSPRTHYTYRPCLWYPGVSSRAPLVPVPHRILVRSRQNCSKTCRWCISFVLLPSRSDSRVCAAKGDLRKTLCTNGMSTLTPMVRLWFMVLIYVLHIPQSLRAVYNSFSKVRSDASRYQFIFDLTHPIHASM